MWLYERERRSPRANGKSHSHRHQQQNKKSSKKEEMETANNQRNRLQTAGMFTIFIIYIKFVSGFLSSSAVHFDDSSFFFFFHYCLEYRRSAQWTNIDLWIWREKIRSQSNMVANRTRIHIIISLYGQADEVERNHGVNDCCLDDVEDKRTNKKNDWMQENPRGLRCVWSKFKLKTDLKSKSFHCNNVQYGTA